MLRCATIQLIPSSLSLPANALMFSYNVLTMSPVLFSDININKMLIVIVLIHFIKIK